MAAITEESCVVESVDPATGHVVARLPATSTNELAGIVRWARAAQSAWAAQPLRLRCDAVRRLGDALYARREELAEVITRETGKPHVEALFGDVLISLDAIHYHLRHAAEFLRDERVPHHNLAVKAKTGTLRYEPYGVIGVIAPWNYPFAIPLGQVIPAVLAGNAVVLKSSELAPSCGALLADCFAQAKFPTGLVQVIQGGGAVGAALIETRPDKIIFTGSVATGKQVAEACARLLIPSVLELGGKDAMIVLNDADVEAASSAAVWGGFTNCGQACLSVERVYVERGIAERFAERCVAKTRLLKLGPGSDPENEVGPMIRPAAVDRVAELLRDAAARGARVLCGGARRPDLGACYFEPTVVAGVSHEMRLMKEEIFGPILAMMTVDNAEEAVALTNDSLFGLSAGIWTRDSGRGRLLAERLKVGAVMVNDVGSYFGIAEAPHGGRNASGWGRTHSRLGLREMVQVKYVDVDRLPRWPKAWWFGYNSALGDSAMRFVEFLYAPGWRERWRSAGGAVKALFRSHRI